MATSAEAEFVGVGLGVGHRATSRLTYSASATPGIIDGSFGFRAEGILTFSLNPLQRSGISPYGGGGLAVLVNRGEEDGFMVLLVGVESAPAGRSGWFVELGVGGGVRAALGLRLRR